MIKIQVTPNKKYLNADMPSSREWSLIWESSVIRTNITAFYFICFVFEIVAKIATPFEINEDGELDHHEGLFSVVSNGIFYLDQDLRHNGQFDVDTHLAWFLIKLFGQLGILPDSSQCIHCHTELKSIGAVFEVQHGGFTCVNCLEKSGEYISQNEMLRRQIQDSSQTKNLIQQISGHLYKDFQSVQNNNKEVISLLFNHLCYQFHMRPTDFKTKSLLF